MQAVKKCSITNESDKYLLVGDCHEVIKPFKTHEEARAALEQMAGKVEGGATRWARIQVVVPNETASCELVSPIYGDNASTISDDDPVVKWMREAGMEPKRDA